MHIDYTAKTPTYYPSVTITPEMAVEMLKRNTKNRNLSDDHVIELARDITSGDYVENGNAIRFDVDGVLVDGQHTLNAIRRANLPIVILVVTGLSRDAQRTIDGGRRRTASDMYLLNGEENSKNLASIINLAWRWDQGARRFSAHLKPTKAEMNRYLNDNPAIRRSAQIGIYTTNHFRAMQPSCAGLGHFLFHRIDPDATVWFMARVVDGAEMPVTHPVMALRARLIKDSLDSVKKTPHRTMSMLITAWNKHRDGESASRMIYDPQANIPDPK